MAARLIVLALAVGLAGFAAVSLRDQDRCQDAAVALFRAAAAKEPVRPGVVGAYIGSCPGAQRLAVAASNLARAGRVQQSIRLADEAIRRQPRNYEGWAALAAALRRRGLDAAAGRALREVRRLNPRFGRAPG